MSQFRDAYDEFRREDVEVAGMSVDSPYTHRVWTEELNLSYPLLSDFNRQFMDAFSVPERNLDLMNRIHTRTTFVIDPQHTLRYAWYGVDAGGLPPIPEILEAVRSL